MIKTAFEHALIAAAIQAAFLWAAGPWVAGAVAVSVFLGREIAQNEYKLAVGRGWRWGEAPPVRWYEGVIKGWGKDGAADVLIPAASCGLIAVMVSGGW